MGFQGERSSKGAGLQAGPKANVLRQLKTIVFAGLIFSLGGKNSNIDSIVDVMETNRKK